MLADNLQVALTCIAVTYKHSLCQAFGSFLAHCFITNFHFGDELRGDPL
jgi:hypothetical protein